MQVIHIQLRDITANSVELRYLLPEKQHYESRYLKLPEIGDFLQQGERDYYKLLPSLRGLGKQLFFWLDGDGRWFRGIQDGLNKKEQRFALLLDDFEANLELRGDGVYVLQPSVSAASVK